ncbi:uncharacterized protein LOC144420943 isoform X2 [Styela clava]
MIKIATAGSGKNMELISAKLNCTRLSTVLRLCIAVLVLNLPTTNGEDTSPVIHELDYIPDVSEFNMQNKRLKLENVAITPAIHTNTAKTHYIDSFLNQVDKPDSLQTKMSKDEISQVYKHDISSNKHEPSVNSNSVLRWFPEATYAGKLKKLGLLAQSVTQTIGNEKRKFIARLNGLLPHILRFGNKQSDEASTVTESRDQVLNRSRRSSSWGDFWYDDEDYELDYCEDPPCPRWSEWHGHGLCNATCGGGKQLLVRYCNNSNPDEFQGGCDGESTKLEDCNMQPCPNWADWRQVDKCSTTCGKGIAKYTRKCLLQGKEVDGCLGANAEFRICSGNESCPPEWTSWSRFSPCTKTCGFGGVQVRRRLCIVDGKPIRRKETPCIGYSTQQRRCKGINQCPPRFSQWTSWTVCDAMTCESTGFQTRSRSCVGPNGRVLSKYRMNCSPDQLSEQRICRTESCKKSCTIVIADYAKSNKTIPSRMYSAPVATWSQWTEWSDCSATCGLDGKQARSRMCFGVRIESKNDTVILKEDKSCEGKAIETRGCHFNIGCPHWDSWEKWGTCTKTCGLGGRRKRKRHCVIQIYDRFDIGEVEESRKILKKTDNGDAEEGSGGNQSESDWENLPMVIMFSGGHDLYRQRRNVSRVDLLKPHWCPDGFHASKVVSPCNEHSCPPRWSRWQAWSECPVTCGKGQIQRSRRCIGKGTCHGNKYEFRACYRPPCWGEWSPYTPCTSSCGKGIRTRARKCRGATAAVPGYDKCEGLNKESITCNIQDCPKWEEWSTWGKCSAPCDGGTMMRTRKCAQGICKGRNNDVASCNYQPCPYWDQWSTFSCCSVTCGDGVKTRNRICRHGKQGEGGCQGPSDDVEHCNPNPCNKTVEPPLSSFQCGIKPKKEQEPILRIFNGRISGDHEWPWQVSWQHYTCMAGLYDCKWEHLCGATLIGPKWVVTAGHCIEEWLYRVVHEDPGEKWSVVIGMTKLYTDGDRYFVRRVFLHPHYEYRGVPRNDIALLKLRESVPLTDNVMPACLPEHHIPQVDDECFITGWGNLYPRRNLSRDLLHASLPLLDFKQCQKLGDLYNTYLNENWHLCAGDTKRDDGADSCRGDSGGPMVCVRNGKWYLTGITSFGFKECGTKGHAGIYAPMNEYNEWVRNTIENYSHNGC